MEIEGGSPLAKKGTISIIEASGAGVLALMCDLVKQLVLITEKGEHHDNVVSSFSIISQPVQAPQCVYTS
jgi:hypothetical protein